MTARTLLFPILLLVLLTAVACGGNDGIKHFTVDVVSQDTIVLNFVPKDPPVQTREVKLLRFIEHDVYQELWSDTLFGRGDTFELHYHLNPDWQYFIRYRDYYENTWSQWYHSPVFTYEPPTP